MMSETHTAVGIGVTLLACQPKTIGEVAICFAITSIASIIPDIDIGTSKSSKELRKITNIMLLGIVVGLIGYFRFGYNILHKDLTIIETIVPIVLLMGILLFGTTRPHREFTHSFFFVLSTASCIYVVLGLEITMYWAVAVLSHICLDLLNKKRVHLLFPLKKGATCFHLCKADSVVSHCIGGVGVILIVYYMINLLA